MSWNEHKALENVAAGRLECLEILLAFNCNLNVRNAERLTPLHLACNEGSMPICERLIYEGADLHSRGGAELETPLMAAIKNRHDNVALLIIKALTHTHGNEYLLFPPGTAHKSYHPSMPDVNFAVFVVGPHEKTAMEYAIYYGRHDVLRKLLAHARELSSEDILGESKERCVVVATERLKSSQDSVTKQSLSAFLSFAENVRMHVHFFLLTVLSEKVRRGRH